MIRPRLLAFVLGQFLAILGLTMLAPFGIAVAYKDGGVYALGLSSLLTIGTGALLAIAGAAFRRAIDSRRFAACRIGLGLGFALWMSAVLFLSAFSGLHRRLF